MNGPTLSRSLARVALITFALLLIPAVAMQFTEEVSWGPSDFVIAGALIFGAGSAMVLAQRKIQQPARRKAALGAIAFALLLLWAELAVGIFH